MLDDSSDKSFFRKNLWRIDLQETHTDQQTVHAHELTHAVQHRHQQKDRNLLSFEGLENAVKDLLFEDRAKTLHTEGFAEWTTSKMYGPVTDNSAPDKYRLGFEYFEAHEQLHGTQQTIQHGLENTASTEEILETVEQTGHGQKEEFEDYLVK